jgi:hypothetical protein
MKLRKLARLYRAARVRAFLARKQGDYQGAAYAHAEARRLALIISRG